MSFNQIKRLQYRRISHYELNIWQEQYVTRMDFSPLRYKSSNQERVVQSVNPDSLRSKLKSSIANRKALEHFVFRSVLNSKPGRELSRYIFFQGA